MAFTVTGSEGGGLNPGQPGSARGYTGPKPRRLFRHDHTSLVSLKSSKSATGNIIPTTAEALLRAQVIYFICMGAPTFKAAGLRGGGTRILVLDT